LHGVVNQPSTPAVHGTPALRVRARRESDLADCVRILAEVHERDGYPVNWPGQPVRWLSPPSQLASWVAELGGHVVGHLALSSAGPDDIAPALWSSGEATRPGGTAVVSRLYVAPAARGHRIGALLMAQAVRQAQRSGLHPVLDVVASDTAAAALYERLGWSLLGVVDRNWGPEQTVTIRSYAAPESSARSLGAVTERL
jgi:ribosomal protein S18 acetylase RimI-like enzyme